LTGTGCADKPRWHLVGIPERVLIYHAGTGRTTFLAMIKVTTLFLGAFFTFILVPSYIKAEKPPLETAGSTSQLLGHLRKAHLC
jgi:hypothetical protein